MPDVDPLEELLGFTPQIQQRRSDTPRRTAPAAPAAVHTPAAQVRPAQRQAPVRARFQVPAAEPDTAGHRFTVWFTPVGAPMFRDDDLEAVIAAFCEEKAAVIGSVALAGVAADDRGGFTATFVVLQQPANNPAAGAVEWGTGTLTVLDHLLPGPVLAKWAISDGEQQGDGGQIGAELNVIFGGVDRQPLANNELEGAVERAMGELTGLFGSLERVADRPYAGNATQITFVVTGTHPGARSPEGIMGGDQFDIGGRTVMYQLTPAAMMGLGRR